MGADVNRGQRPLSPHLQVYRLPLTAVMSILHRITGVGMALGGVLIAWWFAAAASGPEYFAVIDGLMTSVVGHLIWFGLVFALMYHLCNGVRHLIWDLGWGFDLGETRKSNIVVLVMAGAFSVLTLVVGLTS